MLVILTICIFILLLCITLKVIGAIARGLFSKPMPEAREVNRGDIEEILLRLDEIQDNLEDMK